MLCPHHQALLPAPVGGNTGVGQGGTLKVVIYINERGEIGFRVRVKEERGKKGRRKI